MQSLDRHGSVIYMGSLSKVLTQALRIGYLVVPQALAGPLGRALAHEKVVPTATQAMLARLIETGEFARHVRRMRHLYRRRQQALVDGLRGRIGDRLRIATTDRAFICWQPCPPTRPAGPAAWPWTRTRPAGGWRSWTSPPPPLAAICTRAPTRVPADGCWFWASPP
ncbi:aminotransferase class I/II-fold pyridoxal phosphate-dependent enzyme [Tistrella bauzanensis]